MAVLQEVEISKIVISEHRRRTDPARVEALAESVSENGLLQPIGVTPEMRLIFGRHRIEAFKRLGRDRIPALIHDKDDLHVDLAEIDENIQRSPLNDLEEMQAFERRKEIYEELHPETKHHKAGGHAKHGSASDKVAFAEDTAEKIGKSRRTIERAIAIVKRIPKDVQAMIGGTGIANKKGQLEKLSRLPEKDQQRVAEKLSSGDAKTVEQAIDNGRSDTNDDPGTAESPLQVKCPNCGQHEFDPEDGACMQCHEPDVVSPEPAGIWGAEGIAEESRAEEAGLEPNLDGGLEFDESKSLDEFLEALERLVLERINAWHEEYPECPWHLIGDGFEAMAQRLGKNLMA